MGKFQIMSIKQKCTAYNEQFATSGGATRPKFCVTLQRWLSSEPLRYPRLRQAANMLHASGRQYSRKTTPWKLNTCDNEAKIAMPLKQGKIKSCARHEVGILKMRNYRIKSILLIGTLIICLNSIAQSDNYTWSIKFGGAPFSYILNNGETFDWYGNSMGYEMFLIGVGYKNFNLSTTYRYFQNATKKDLPYSNTHSLSS